MPELAASRHDGSGARATGPPEALEGVGPEQIPSSVPVETLRRQLTTRVIRGAFSPPCDNPTRRRSTVLMSSRSIHGAWRRRPERCGAPSPPGPETFPKRAKPFSAGSRMRFLAPGSGNRGLPRLSSEWRTERWRCASRSVSLDFVVRPWKRFSRQELSCSAARAGGGRQALPEKHSDTSLEPFER
jgi:hypothetical protein